MVPGVTSGDDEESSSSSASYRRQKRGGKGLRDIKATDRNGQVVDAMSVADDDEVLIVTSKGKIQRLRAADISTIGRNTQGVRIMKLDAGDTLASCAVIASEDIEEEAVQEAEAAAEGQTDSAAAPETPAEPESPSTEDADE